MLISPRRKSAWLAAPLVVLFLGVGCSRAPHLIEYDEQSNARASAAPLVVVGVVDSDIPIGGRIPSRHDPKYPMQLHRVRVRVENVLRGSISEQRILVYYFGFAGGFNGPRPLGFGREPSRRILWLRRDGGAFRMACDGWDNCTVFVMSGAHPRYQADPQKSLDHALADILLTRGEGEVNNLRFARQIRLGVPAQGIEDYVIEKLSHLALTELSDVKSSACELLWIYSRDRIASRVRQEAQESLGAANCNCRLQPDGNVRCQQP